MLPLTRDDIGMLMHRKMRKREEIESLTRDLREFESERRRTSNLYLESALVIQPLGKMVEQKNRSLWGRMTKLGYVLIALPIPIVTEVMGAILIAVGFFMKKVEGGRLKLRGVYDEFEKTIKEIREIRQHTSS